MENAHNGPLTSAAHLFWSRLPPTRNCALRLRYPRDLLALRHHSLMSSAQASTRCSSRRLQSWSSRRARSSISSLSRIASPTPRSHLRLGHLSTGHVIFNRASLQPLCRQNAVAVHKTCVDWMTTARNTSTTFSPASSCWYNFLTFMHRIVSRPLLPRYAQAHSSAPRFFAYHLALFMTPPLRLVADVKRWTADDSASWGRLHSLGLAARPGTTARAPSTTLDVKSQV
jgi:hypothetical protein